jgi:ribosomal protein S8
MIKISEAVGLMDGNVSNLSKTVESGILEPLKQAGYIESYEKVPNGSDIKFQIKRTRIDKKDIGREAGSVKEGGRVGKGTRQGR